MHVHTRTYNTTVEIVVFWTGLCIKFIAVSAMVELR